MKPKNIKKIILLSLLGAAVVLAGGYAAYKGYRHVRQVRLVKDARAYLEKNDGRKALLCIQRALRYNNRDVEACRMMAELAEFVSPQRALLWRSRVVEINPRSLDDRLALTRVALAQRDYATATNALAGVDAAGQKTPGYHNIAGAVAAAAAQLTLAEHHFSEAARLEPTNPAPRLNLATVRLQSTNAATAASARATLQQLSTAPTDRAVACQALRELTADAVRKKNLTAALATSKQLIEDTNSVFSDRLARLDVLQEARSPEFKSTLAAFQREAVADARKISVLATWQMARTSPQETLVWLQGLPASTRTNQPVTLLVAEAQSRIQDWRGLQTTLQGQFWSELDFLRHAYLAQAQRGQNLTAGAKGEWELAMKATGEQKSAMLMLYRIAGQWRWFSEAEELLWAIYNRYPDDRAVYSALYQTLYLEGRTRPLMMLFSQEMRRSPANIDLKNNLALTALLLEASELKPHDMAREVYQSVPTNASYASTYAFSLYLQKKNSEALKVMQTLPLTALSEPSVAGYYGLVLKAAGDRAKARPYLDLAFKARMLPEEKKLFEQGRAGI